MIELKLQSSLSKIMPDETPKGIVADSGVMVMDEVFAYQIAYTATDYPMRNIQIEVDSPIAANVCVREEGLVPATLSMYKDADADVIRKGAAIYPDPLLPITDYGVCAATNTWRALWVSVSGVDKAGKYPITVRFTYEGKVIGETTFTVEVLNAKSGKGDLIYTTWFYCDCIMNSHGVKAMSEEFWQLLAKYFTNYAEHGGNMILTPIFTPALDTAVGTERPTVQLIDVEVDNGYSFNFDKLGRWIELAQKCGIEYFEISHLFTQWGAEFCPKIMATVNGEYKRIFGWESSSVGEEYAAFLGALLPKLTAYLRDKGVADKSYFHISDEPSEDNIPHYKACGDIIRKYTSGFKTIDALSSIEIYKQGLVDTPIPASNHIEPFIEAGIKDLWTYYCCGQSVGVSNRFMCFAHTRNRILGYQMFKYDIAGFLQWGYNFWNSCLSMRVIDPYKVTDGECAFPAGDPFVVYPGDDCVIDSVRHEVFREGLQDMRVFKAAAQKLGKDKVIAEVEEAPYGMTFMDSVISEEKMLRYAENLRRALVES